MKIKNLKIKNYKKFKDLEVNFDSGINVIVGANEAGKSTVAQALMDLLYADPSTKSQTFFSKTKSWGSNILPSLEMTFYALDAQYRLTKDFNTKQLLLENLDTKVHVDTYKESLASIKKFIGINTEQVYRKTAFINQGDVALIDSSDDLLHEVTNNGSGESHSGIQGVIKKLQLELNNLNRGIDHPANNPGPIKLQQDKIARLKEFYAEKMLRWEKRQKASGKQESSGGQLDKVKKKIEETEALLKNYKIAKEAIAELDEIGKEISMIEEKITSLEKLDQEQQKLAAESAKYSNYENAQIEDDIKSIVELEQSLNLTEKDLASLNKSTEVKEQSIVTEKIKQESRFPLQLFAVAAVVFLSLVVAGYIYYQSQKLLVPSIVTIIGILLAVTIVIWRRVINNESGKVQESNQNPLESLRTDLENRQESDKAALGKILQKYSAKSAADFYSSKADYVSLKTRYNDLASQKKIILGDMDREALKKRQVDLLVKKKEIETTTLTEQVKNSQIGPEKYLEKSRELDKLYIEQKKIEEELIVSKTRVGDSEVEYSELVSLEEEMELAKSHLSYLMKRQKVLGLTISAIQEAVLEVSKSANKILADTINVKLPVLTNNHYSRVKVNSDLTINVYASEKNDWVDPVKELSRGTIDQIYFLVRLGFLKLITENKSIPLILDDPFVTSDALRREKCREILAEISKQFQILLFTNDPAYTDWGNTVVLS